MTCESCGDKPKKCDKGFTRAVMEIDNPEQIALLRKVVIPASMGDESSVPPSVGKYRNVLLQYESSKKVYIYSSDGIPTLLEMNVPDEVWDRIQYLDTKISNETKNREDADEILQTKIDAEAKSREDADELLDGRLTTVEDIASTALQPDAINKVVMTDISLSANSSTTTVQIDGAKENLLTGVQTTKNLPLPVASHTAAGVVNSATFDAIANNTSNINALMSGAVAITGLSASPSQSDLTNAWEAGTGLSELMNRASIYDVTNNKVWTYYTNDTTWHAATNTSQVTINTFTNSSEGTIKGSTNVGQIFAESDGTGSVNGWDSLSGAVSTNTGDIASLQTGKQDKLTAGTNITISSGNVISASSTPYTAGNAISIDTTDNNRIDADVYPADFFTADEKTSGEGSKISLQNTIDAPLKSLNIKGDTFQQTYTGKNLVDALNTNWVTSNATLTKTDDVLEMTATSGQISRCNLPLTGLVEGTTYTLSFDVYGVSVSSVSGLSYVRIRETATSGNWVSDGVIIEQTTDYTRLNITFTATSVSNPFVWFYISANSANTNNIDIFVKNIQLEANSIPTSYEPFVGSTPTQITPSPNPDYPQDINVVTGVQTVTITGKNLFDNPVSNGSGSGLSWVKNVDGSITINGTASAGKHITGLYSIPQSWLGKTITLSIGNSNANVNAGFKNSVGGQDQIVVTYGQSSVTATVTQDNIDITGSFDIYVRPNTALTDFTIYPQVELNNQPTTYEPYTSQSYTVDLGSIELAKIGTYQDYIYKSGDDWYVHKDIGRYTFTGSENWTASTYGNNSWRIDNVLSFPFDTNKVQVICNIFTGIKHADRSTTPNEIYTSQTNELFVRNTSFTTLAEMQTATTGNYIYYALATPTNTKITDSTLIGQLNALFSANSYLGSTNLLVTATGTNLPIILNIEAYRKSLAGILAVMNTDTQIDLDIFTNNEWNALWA